MCVRGIDVALSSIGRLDFRTVSSSNGVIFFIFHFLTYSQVTKSYPEYIVIQATV